MYCLNSFLSIIISMCRFEHFLSCVGQTGRMRQKSILDEAQLQAELQQLLRGVRLLSPAWFKFNLNYSDVFSRINDRGRLINIRSPSVNMHSHNELWRHLAMKHFSSIFLKNRSIVYFLANLGSTPWSIDLHFSLENTCLWSIFLLLLFLRVVFAAKMVLVII